MYSLSDHSLYVLQAVGAQMFFDSMNTGGYNYEIDGQTVTLRSADSLRQYDPELVELLEEVFSCPNQLINRCHFKGTCS